MHTEKNIVLLVSAKSFIVYTNSLKGGEQKLFTFIFCFCFFFALIRNALNRVPLFLFLLIPLPVKYFDGEWNQICNWHSQKWCIGQPGAGGWNFTFCKETLFTKGYFISLWVFGLGLWRTFIKWWKPESTILLGASGTFGKRCSTKTGREILLECYPLLLLLCRRTVS